MSERYNKLFHLEENLYIPNSPVIICAGALLKDNDTNRLLIQLKFRNISNKKIKCLKVAITAIDSLERELDNNIFKEYLDLNISRNGEFGSKTPVFINNTLTRSFKATVVEVGFSDNSYWSNNSNEWVPLPRQQLLSEKFSSNAIYEYQGRFSSKCKYFPTTYNDIWLCSCGSVNAKDEESCYACNSTLLEMSKVDSVELHNEGSYKKAVYLLSTNELDNIESAKNIFEKILDWRDSRKKLEECSKKINDINANREKSKKLTKRITIITVPTICAVIAFILALILIIIPQSKYNDAVNLMNEGEFQEAIQIFEELGEYKDSSDNIEKIKLLAQQQATVLASEQKFQEAYDLLESVGFTKDTVSDMGAYEALAKNDYRTAIEEYGVTNIIIPYGVTEIDVHEFEECSSLTSIIIPDSVIIIDDYAFSNCSSLTSVTIPNSVTSIGISAFRECSSLTNITIPGSVTSIGNSAFNFCKKLTSVAILDGVTNIGDYTFESCKNLTSITIPDSITNIGRCAFGDCVSLTSITIPHSVTNIWSEAFDGCSSLTSVTIPDSVTIIGDEAFSGCSNLTSIYSSIYYGGTATDWASISIGSRNSALTNAPRYYYSETQPTDTTYLYWHSVDGVPTKW